MDIISHAAAGAATGAMFGHPVLGALCAIVPDISLARLERFDTPPSAYVFHHSLLFIICVWVASRLFADADLALCATLAVTSHIMLDLPTHGVTWAPQLLYPFSRRSFSFSSDGEWEWLNAVWVEGLAFTALWITVCLSLTP